MILLNDQLLDVTQFPDNTSQVWKILNIDKFNFAFISWQFSHEGEFLQLAQLKMLLDQYGLKTYLRLTYLPYGRQDKEISNSSTFALHTFSFLLNSLKFKEVVIVDPHSSVSLDLIDNSRAVYPVGRVMSVLNETGADIICYPDKGALVKYSKVYWELKAPFIYGEKVRDQLTGNITGYSVMGDPSGKNVLIVDDICDGGMTFKILAKDLLALGAKSVVLFVTHGLFSKGTRTLFDSGISRIFTADTEITKRSSTIQL
jgi:ribose-phosphate pyrophosphokinase